MRRKRSIFDLLREYLEEFEEATEELFESFSEKPSWDPESHSLEPLFDVSVSSDNVIVTADMPYADPKSIKIRGVRDNLIEISADMKVKMNFERLGVPHREGEFSCFRCQVPLPVPVDISRAKARLTKGILEIILPREKGYPIKVE